MKTPSQRSAWLILFGLMACQTLFWTLIPSLTHISMPLDVVEGLAWGHEWQWGYYKHPPLPSWLLEASFTALGDVGPFLLSQLTISLAYFFVFLLAKEIYDTRRALIGTALLTGVYYFSLPTPEYNHNIAQIPLWAAGIFFFYKALQTRALLWWFCLGTALGLGLLTKYSVLVLMAVIGLYLLLSKQHRNMLLSFGPYLALAITLLVITPHIQWLIDHDFLPFRYVEKRAGMAMVLWLRPIASIKFLSAQLADHLPMLIILVTAGLYRKSSISSRNSTLSQTDRRFLLAFGLGPVLLVSLVPLFTGMGLRSMWGTPLFTLSGLLIVSLLPVDQENVKIKRFTYAVIALLVTMPMAYGAKALYGWKIAKKANRLEWPDQEITQRMMYNWNSNNKNCPLKIVGGSDWLGGMISLRAEKRPSLLFDGNFEISPWITPEQVQQHGALLVWKVKNDQPSIPEAFKALPGFALGGMESFNWPRAGTKFAPLTLGWGMVPCG
ncbi:MAG: glycosyltransferase family 39 protein [Magnetococcales bacterium]|nr:glycosyltransferase family 39 protein [Magnetococcales bacterium]